jgi:hypothetical protein
MSIVFVTGVSTAGKTSLYEAFRDDADLHHVEFHDIDEDGVPPAGSGHWRIFRIELLLHEAAVRFRESGRSTVVCGATTPHEVIESGSFPTDIPVHFILIDAEISTVRERLRERIGDRVSADSLEMSIQSNRALSTVLRNAVQSLRNGAVVGPGQSKAEVRHQVKQLVLAHVKGRVVLPPCPICGLADWPEGGMHAARSMHLNAHERAARAST